LSTGTKWLFDESAFITLIAIATVAHAVFRVIPPRAREIVVITVNGVLAAPAATLQGIRVSDKP